MSADIPSDKVEACLVSDSDFRMCEDVARREGRNFHWGFRFLSASQRQDLSALYAFARMTDDIVDEESRAIPDRRRILREWKDDLRSALESGRSHLPILRAVAAAAARSRMPHEEMYLLVEGCEDDLSIRRYKSSDETLRYCRKVAVTVGYLMLAIFGVRDAGAKDSMTSLGYAFQLTNIIRDVAEDLRRDRIYMAEEDLLRHGVTESMLAAGRATPETKALLEDYADRAADFYARSEGLYEFLEPGQRKTMRAMSRIYGAILDEVRKQDFDVWSRRPRVSTPRKILIVLATSLGL